MNVAPSTNGSGHRRRLLVLEPYFGGSHKAVLDCLLPALGWEFDLLTLPARKWKWRMRGAAVNFAAEVRSLAADDDGANPPQEVEGGEEPRRWDAVLASTFLDLAVFKGLAGQAIAGLPSVVYFHENQFVYPNRYEADWDLQFPLINVTSALAADACWFNTRWNMESFLEEVDPFIRRFPDHHPKGLAAAIAPKCSVLHPPFDPAPIDAVRVTRGPRCRIVWPHRWEHDKDPDTFFAVMGALVAEGLDFEVALAGQSFKETREDFVRAAAVLGDRLVHLGEPENRTDYAGLLATCDVAVSTARNEFFGLAMLEAAYAGCLPLVPDRLAYPELYPGEMRYGTAGDLIARLRSLIRQRPEPGRGRQLAGQFTIGALAPAYREAFDELVRR